MKLLIVVDCQNDFITGGLGSKEATKILQTIQHKIDALQTNDMLIFTKDLHTASNDNKTIEEKKLPLHCEMNTYGAEITDELTLDNCPCAVNIVRKSTFIYNMWDYYLYDFLEDINEIELCGLCTDICVISNALYFRSLFPYTPITVDARACAGSTPHMHDIALQVMKANLIEVVNMPECRIVNPFKLTDNELCEKVDTNEPTINEKMETLLPKEHIEKLTRFSRYDINVLNIRLLNMLEKISVEKNVCKMHYKDKWWIFNNFVNAYTIVRADGNNHLESLLEKPTSPHFLRPVIEFENNKKMNVGEEFVYFGENFIVISIENEMAQAFCLNNIGMCRYNDIPDRLQEWLDHATASYTTDKLLYKEG